MKESAENNAPLPRRPYERPAVRRVPLVPEELFVASCVKTPNVCRPIGAKKKVKS
jgi:hypothetical protein